MKKQDLRSDDILIQRLERFTRKFYLNRIIRGALLFSGLILAIFLLFSFLEYEFYFAQGVRKLLFFGFLAVVASSFYWWIGRPLIQYFNLGKRMSHEQAAMIIGTHFSDVQDKLLNILQLRHQLTTGQQSSLLLASIDQKTENLRLVPFQGAIDLTKNRKYLRYALPPLFLLALLLAVWPSMISEGSGRIIKNNVYFEKPAPFYFQLDERALEAVEFSDYTLRTEVTGALIPERAFVHLGELRYEMSKVGHSTFEFTIKNVRNDVDFYFSSGEVESAPHKLVVYRKPRIDEMTIKAYYPKYLNRAPETFQNNGDLNVPIGTHLQWQVAGQETNKLEVAMYRDDQREWQEVMPNGQNAYEWKKSVYSDLDYALYVSNEVLHRADSMKYSIEAIADQAPHIEASYVEDSTQTDFRYFTGRADDDHGLSALHLVTEIRNGDGEVREHNKIPIKSVEGFIVEFDYLFSADSFSLNEGENLEYYFEVWDNDGVQGAKSARTESFYYRQASLKELEQKSQENSESIKTSFEENLDKTQSLKEDIRKLKEKFLNKKELSWQDRKEIEKLLQKQEEIKKALEEARKKLEENKESRKKLSPNAEPNSKEERIESLMDKVKDEELQKLMDEIRKMLEDLQRENSIEQMENMENQSQEMELQMDKLLELYKQLEIETRIQKEVDKLNELGEKQEELSEKTMDEQQSEEDLSEEQKELTESFDEIKKELEKIREDNKELQSPKKIEDTENLEKEISKEQKKSELSLDEDGKKQDDQAESEGEEESDDKKEEEDPTEDQSSPAQSSDPRKQAAGSQKNAGQKLKEMAEKIQSGMQAGQQEQMSEDIKTIRQLLENLLTLSFDEEYLIDEVNSTSDRTTRYVELIQRQFKIQNDFSVVRDSVHALSKRNESIQEFVMDKVADIENNLEKSIRHLEERQKAQAGVNQQYAMTYINDLAVMLSESMANMQQQLSAMTPGNQMCQNPKPGPSDGQKPSDKITQGQSEIKKGLEKMMKEKQQGNRPGSEDFAKMAQQQAEMRKLLRDMQKENSEHGQNNALLQEIIDAMDAMERDLVNKQLTNDMLQRQQDIETRLLEAEKAERQRKQDEKRESIAAEEKKSKLPPAIEEYLKERQNQVREFHKTSPALNPYFKRLVENYYKSLNN